MTNETITAMEGITVGHAEVPGIPSGCTVILPEGGAVAGVDIRGGAPGTIGTDTLYPLNLVEKVHALFFTGGSAFGLSVAEGVRYFLKERNIGFDTGYALVPIVAGAVIYDLALNATDTHPDAGLGYEACENASIAPMEDGNVGAGKGASVGKIHGMQQAMKSGIGSVCLQAPSGLKVAALMVVNAFGDVVDPVQNRPIAGCRRHPETLEVGSTELEMLDSLKVSPFLEGQGTVVGAVITNAVMNKTQLTKVAQMAHDGLARTVSPSHTQYDGDTIFALSHGDLQGVDSSIVGTLAATATAQAILKATRSARSIEGLPGLGDFFLGVPPEI